MSIAAGVVLRPARPTATTPVRLSAAWWSIRGHRIRLLLLREGVAYRSADLAALPLANERARLPTVLVDGERMVCPTVEEVRRALRRHALIPPAP